MIRWYHVRVVAPGALSVLAVLGFLVAVGAKSPVWLGALIAALALVGLWVWLLGIRSHDQAIGELRAVAEVVTRGGEVRFREVLDRPDELGAFAMALRRASEELALRSKAHQLQRDELRTVLLSIEEGLVAADADLRVLHWNPRATDLLGVAAAPEAGAALAEVVDNTQVLALARRALESGRNERTDVPLFGGASGKLRVDLTAAPLAGGDEVRGVVLVLRDVTELIEKARLQREFAANVSHELRTPLSLIKGFVETLQGGALGDPDKGPRFLGIIDRHAGGLERLVDDLLTLLTLEGRTEQTEPEPIDVKVAVAPIAAGFEARLEREGIELRCSIPDGLPLISARRHHFTRAVRNLIDNAIKYSRSDRIEVEAERDGGRVAISVADNGIGIPAEDLPHVFERFYRVDKSRSRERGGTGLGLAIVKHIMQLEGGEVSVRSELGGGTTFTVSFGVEP